MLSEPKLGEGTISVMAVPCQGAALPEPSKSSASTTEKLAPPLAEKYMSSAPSKASESPQTKMVPSLATTTPVVVEVTAFGSAVCVCDCVPALTGWDLKLENVPRANMAIRTPIASTRASPKEVLI